MVKVVGGAKEVVLDIPEEDLGYYAELGYELATEEQVEVVEKKAAKKRSGNQKKKPPVDNNPPSQGADDGTGGEATGEDGNPAEGDTSADDGTGGAPTGGEATASQ
jgi:hypothetical protein